MRRIDLPHLDFVGPMPSLLRPTLQATLRRQSLRPLDLDKERLRFSPTEVTAPGEFAPRFVLARFVRTVCLQWNQFRGFARLHVSNGLCFRMSLGESRVVTSTVASHCTLGLFARVSPLITIVLLT